MNQFFKERTSVFDVEEGNELQPKFDGSGLIPVVTTDILTKNIAAGSSSFAIFWPMQLQYLVSSFAIAMASGVTF